MRGIRNYNFPAFHRAAAVLREANFTVFNPAERDEFVYGKEVGKSETGDLGDAVQKGFSLREALAADTQWICLRADAVALLPGWSNSKGANAEKALAEALGLTIIYLGYEGEVMHSTPQMLGQPITWADVKRISADGT